MWNICNETEIPVAETMVSDKALNKAKWSADGKRLITGDSAGHIYVYDLSSQIYSPRTDEKGRFEKKISNAILKMEIDSSVAP